MRSLMSINYKFMDLTPKELVDMINTSKYCKGVEIYIRNNNLDELDYLDKLVYELQRNDLILQVHGDSSISVDEQINFLKTIDKYAAILGYQITVTLHSVYDEDMDIQKEKTINYFNEILDQLDTDRLIICLENLNDDGPYERLNKDIVEPIILNDDRLFMTYDVGHEIADYRFITDVNGYLMSEIKNIHMHTLNEKGLDHQPIYKNSVHWNSVLKGLLFLIDNKYEGNVVYEYDVYCCYGDNIREQIQDYLNSIDFVSERYGE